MFHRLKYKILRWMLALMPVIAIVAPTAAQNIVYAGETNSLSVAPVPGESYEWELYNDINSLNLAVVPGNCPVSNAFFVGGINTGPSVSVTWLIPGTYYFKVTATTSCTKNLAIGEMTVLYALPTAILLPPGPICAGDSVHLTVQLTGTPPWSIILTDGSNNWNFNNIALSPYTFTLPVIPMVTTSYWITTVTDAHGTNTTPSIPVLQVVNPRPPPVLIYHN
jgi:hypothetical protein